MPSSSVYQPLPTRIVWLIVQWLSVISHYLLVFLLVYADSAYSQGVYYIQLTQNNPWPQYLACMTLSQFANSIKNYYKGSEINTFLFLLPGNHYLDRELSVANLNNFSMTKETQGIKSVTIKINLPPSQSGSYQWHHICLNERPEFCWLWK